MEGATDRLAKLPIFLRLEGRAALVAGDDAGAAWKAELLAAAGADTRVFSAAPGARLEALAASGRARLTRRAWTAADFAGVALATLATSDDAEAVAFRAAGRSAGALVNVIDRPAFCDFTFGALVNRSPLVVAISTEGAAPAFARALRARLEALLPPVLAEWTRAARDWRAKLKPLNLSLAERNGFWERFSALALGAGRLPETRDFDALASSAPPMAGEIMLIGAGPGDPELITLKAVAALQRADVVLYDKLVNPRLLEFARREAERIDVGKRAGQPSMKQREITELAISLARAGKRVARLKGGDASVFGRASEEIAAARAAGVKLTLVPGVTTALAAAAELGVSLSDRERASRIQFAAAHDGEGELTQRLNWPALAADDATTAIYMGKRKLDAFIARLMAEGLDPATPAIYARDVSLPGAWHVRAPIGDLPRAVAETAGDGPALLLYGAALGAGGEV